jgi:hypothetical protein
MSEIENNGLVGHPITNMLMREACAGDLGAADHADGAGIELTAAAEPTVGAVGGDRLTDHLGDELPPELAGALKEFEELFENGRALVVQTLDRFDTFGEGIGAILAHIVRLEAKVDRVLTHFGEAA